MKAVPTSLSHGDTTAILDRHATRRATGVPTVSVLIGPIEGGVNTWRSWAEGMGRDVVLANRNQFPSTEWVCSVGEQFDLPAAAVGSVAARLNRRPDELLAALRAKSPADRERFWLTFAPDADDPLLQALATAKLTQDSPDAVAARLSEVGDGVVAMISRLVPTATWPSVLFRSGATEDFLSAAPVAATWAMRVPAIPIAMAVPTAVWEEYLATAPDSRTKALLREGELAVPIIDHATVEQALYAAGATDCAIAAVVANEADQALLEAAVTAAWAIAEPPTNEAEDDRARSAAERFLFKFLESLPETVGRFELNACLDFHFGRRPAEVDLLCRSARVAIELDGYFHFLAPEGYRRDRTKDWELQRRGFVVLRFLAEDVIPQLEAIRDRILDALSLTPPGVHP